MPTRPHHRKLIDHLAGWDEARIARLLQRRPDLTHPVAPADIAELAQRAQERPSVVTAVGAATLPEDRVMQLVVCSRPGIAVADLAAALPGGVGIDDIEPTLAALDDAALVWRHDGRVHCSGTLRQALPTTLGPPFQAFVRDITVDQLKHAVLALRASAEDGGHDTLPPRPIGAGSRAPRKADLVDELEQLLATSGAVEAALRSAPPSAAELARTMAADRPAVDLVMPLHFSRYGRGASAYQRKDPTYWLFERALVLPGNRGEIGLQPREVGVALRGGRPIDDLALDGPTLDTGAVDPDEVDSRAASQAARTLHLLADLIDLWSATPATALKSGGLGAKAMKSVASTLEVGLDDAERLVELAYLAGLVTTSTTSRKEGRRYVDDTVASPTPAAARWVERPPGRRATQLATAWLRAGHWPSASGRVSGEGDRKAMPVLSHQMAASAPARRRDVLDLLGTLEPGRGTTPEALAAAAYRRRPHPWLRVGAATPGTLVGWVATEADLLGVTAGGALSTFGRALLADDRRAAERAFAAALPAQAQTFTLQTDLTATFVGDLDRDVLVELRLLADVESTGAATTLRFSDASLRRAVDAGRDGDAILAFLDAHADKGVPAALAYLVNDVVRRHGHLTVGAAGAVVTSDDPAVLADACSHRRTRKLALRLLAPTVAVSPQAPGKVLEGLRTAGFLPVADGESPGAVALAASGAPAAAHERTATGTSAVAGTGRRGATGDAGETDAGAGASADRLPEPFRIRPEPAGGPARTGAARRGSPWQARTHGPAPTSLDDSVAAAFAKQIVAGHASGPPPVVASPPRSAPRRARDDQTTLPIELPFSFGFANDPDPVNLHAGPSLDDLDADLDDLVTELDDLGVVEVDSLDDVLAAAAETSSVVAVVLGDGDDRADPILLDVTEWEPGRVAGIDLADGVAISIATEHIGAAAELGRIGEVAPDLLGPPRGARPRRNRGGRRR